MMVRAIYAGGHAYEVTGDGYRPAGEFRLAGERVQPGGQPALMQLLCGGALCSNAVLEESRARSARTWSVQGDPTEGALVVAAAKAGYTETKLGDRYQKQGEAPFSSERRRMSVLVRDRLSGEQVLHVKGAPDTVLGLCTQRLDDRGRVVALQETDRRAIMAEVDRLAGQALRVLAMACRSGPGKGDPEAMEHNLVFMGLAGMIDPPRSEVKRAVQEATLAGIRTAMITGDHPATALAVARELGIATAGAGALTGADLERMSDGDLVAAAGTVRVFARVSPQHKLRIVRAFKARGEIVAMTGDGVNDAPAVKEADIGVAMGRTGTDVTREASQLVLADDNYATIVAAVEEGRGIYENIRKFIRYLLSCNTGEVLTMFLAAVARLPLPLLPIQILWVNLVTDGLPAMALGVDPTDPDAMRRPPRRPDEGVFSRGLGRKILGRGLLIGISTVGMFVWGLWDSGPGDPAALARARTLALATLVMCQLFHVFDCRSERRSIWEIGWFSNPWLVAAVTLSTAMLMAAVYFRPLARVMETVPLSLFEWLVILGVAGAAEAVVALRRLVLYRRPVPLKGARI